MSNHIFTIWQHIVLLVLRQYEEKSYRMFVEWLIEAYYLRTGIIQLSHIPHYTTLQKFAATVSGTILERIILDFINVEIKALIYTTLLSHYVMGYVNSCQHSKQ
ncbi:MAG: hypothetical protein WBZ20_06860 [Nitrososphaeraceae archaeon]